MLGRIRARLRWALEKGYAHKTNDERIAQGSSRQQASCIIGLSIASEQSAFPFESCNARFLLVLAAIICSPHMIVWAAFRRFPSSLPNFYDISSVEIYGSGALPCAYRPLHTLKPRDKPPRVSVQAYSHIGEHSSNPLRGCFGTPSLPASASRSQYASALSNITRSRENLAGTRG